MQTELATTPDARNLVIIVGGNGGLRARYRELVESQGYRFEYYEQRLPTKSAPLRHKIALVIVMVTMISHPLMAQARTLASDGARVVYLKSPSVSAVRQTVAQANG